MNDAGTLPVHMLEIRELTPEAFAPYGQIVMPLKTGGQGAETGYDPENSTREAKLVLNNGEPRLWIMHLPHVGLGFSRIARHRRVTQCLGSLGGKEWLIGVAPPGTTARDLSDEARPRVEDIVAFRVLGTNRVWRIPARIRRAARDLRDAERSVPVHATDADRMRHDAARTRCDTARQRT